MVNSIGYWNHIDIIAESAREKHGRFWTGTTLQIVNPNETIWQNNDIVVLFAWNFYEEIREQLIKLGFNGKILRVLPNIPTMEDIHFERN